MPLYYFHVVDDDGRTADDEGMELTDLMAVAQEAEASARDLLIHDLRANRPIDDRGIEVTDENGTVVLVQLLKDLIQ